MGDGRLRVDSRGWFVHPKDGRPFFPFAIKDQPATNNNGHALDLLGAAVLHTVDDGRQHLVRLLLRQTTAALAPLILLLW